MEAKDKIIRAKIKLQKEKPFWAFLLSYLNFHEDKTIKTGTMGVDYKGNVFYSKDFVESLNDEELKGVLAHELGHIILNHLKRGKGKDGELFNVACDIVVNNLLVNDGFILPKGSLIPDSNELTITFMGKEIVIKDINKKSAEEVYLILKKHIKDLVKNEIKKLLQGKECNIEIEEGKGKGGGITIDVDDLNLSEKEKEKLKEKLKEINKELNNKLKSQDKHIRGKGKGKESEKIEKEWKKRISEAVNYAKMRGNLPAGLERFVEELLEGKINWKQILNRYLTNNLFSDFSFKRPSKRSQAVGVYLPSAVKENVDVVVSVDTSGSISDEELKEFLSEMVAMARTYSNIQMTIIVNDCEIKNVYPVHNGSIKKIEEISKKLTGGGGTSHIPVFDWVVENKKDCKVLINFTDGYTEFPERKQWNFDVIWVITKEGCDEKNIPFGKVIKIN